ncbi:MAG TPA: phosphate regulon sensor histidine kinase PhoR [Macromonas sp.]|nr:phosphate regulon sensor histidine kinase PhoR [Macromonas sp.]
MIRRSLELLVCALIGGVWAVQTLRSAWSGVAGAMGGALLWVVFDEVRALRVLRWLRHAETAPAPNVSAVWSELVERARKQFKALARKAAVSESRLQEFLAAIQASPVGVVLLGESNAIEWSNFTAAQHLGFDARRDVQQQVRNLVRDPDFIAYLNAEEFGRSVEINGREAYPGHPHRLSINIHPYGKGRKLLLTRDITTLELAEAMRRDFVANVSHEIRTPLTVLSGFIETMQHLPLGEQERNQYLGLMEQQAQRMQTLVSDLLTLSRLEGSPAPDASHWLNPHDMLEQAVADARALSGVLAQGAHQIRSDQVPAFEIAGARGELFSAMGNLLSNAVRYTPAGGRIESGWKLLPDGGAEFYVIDTGPGIDAVHLPRLTERFYRVDRSRSRETGGTGLGLAIVKHVIQRHGGQVLVDSVPGQGSTFRLVLPSGRVRALGAD